VVEEDGLSDSPETYARFLSICRHIQVSWYSETCRSGHLGDTLIEQMAGQMTYAHIWVG